MVGEALASDTTFFRFCTTLANTLILSGTTWVAPAYHRTCFRCCETIHTHSCSVVVVPASMCNTGSFFYEIHVSSSLSLSLSLSLSPHCARDPHLKRNTKKYEAMPDPGRAIGSLARTSDGPWSRVNGTGAGDGRSCHAPAGGGGGGGGAGQGGKERREKGRRGGNGACTPTHRRPPAAALETHVSSSADGAYVRKTTY